MSFQITDLLTGPMNPADISKIVSAQKAGYLGDRLTMNLILPEARAWNGLRYTTKRNYSTQNLTAMVLNKGEALEIGGNKHDLQDYKPQSFKLKTTYNIDDVREYSYMNNAADMSETFRTEAFAKHNETIENSDNALTILSLKGGVIKYPIATGDGGTLLTDIDFGKVHSNAAGAAAESTKKQDSVTITGGWATGTWAVQEADHLAIQKMFKDKGIDYNSLLWILSQEAWDAQTTALRTINTTTKTNPNVNMPTVTNIDAFQRIIDGKRFICASDSVAIVVNGVSTTYNLVDSKKMVVVGDKKYHDHVYLTPSTGLINAPVKYFAHTAVEGSLADSYVHYTLSKQFIYVDPNAVCELQVIA
jgi:hypothetical protein